MDKLFQTYNLKYDHLKDLLQDDVPRSLRLFNIRFRLALDIQVDFKGEISLTKSKQVRDTYVLIIRLMETWNAYEALSHYAKDLEKHSNPKAGKSKIYSQKLLKTVGSLDVLKENLDQLKTKYKKEEKFRNDFDQYIERIIQDPRIKGILTEDSTSILQYFKDEKELSGIEILSLIYAERNMYYHNGETAKMGMSYTNRKNIISNYIHCLVIHTLLLINFILDEEIRDNE